MPGIATEWTPLWCAGTAVDSTVVRIVVVRHRARHRTTWRCSALSRASVRRTRCSAPHQFARGRRRGPGAVGRARPLVGFRCTPLSTSATATFPLDRAGFRLALATMSVGSSFGSRKTGTMILATFDNGHLRARSQRLCPGPRRAGRRRLASRHRAAVRSHRYSTRETPPELPEKRCFSSSTEPTAAVDDFGRRRPYKDVDVDENGR